MDGQQGLGCTVTIGADARIVAAGTARFQDAREVASCCPADVQRLGHIFEHEGDVRSDPMGGSRALLFSQNGFLPPVTASGSIRYSVADAPAADTPTKTILGERFRAQVMYGLAGGRPACGALASCTLRTVSLSGRSATYIRYTYPQTFDGATYPNKVVGYIPVGHSRPNEPESGLLLNGWCQDQQSCRTLESLFLSIRIGR